jgi:hypothetical protein
MYTDAGGGGGSGGGGSVLEESGWKDVDCQLLGSDTDKLFRLR